MTAVRVLMVCLGNICRSPTAEAMLRLRAAEAGLQDVLEVDSAGTSGWHVGDPPDRRAVAQGERRGLSMGSLRGRQVCRADFDRFDEIFAMDAQNLADLERLRPPGARARLRLLMDCVPGREGLDVPDPYAGTRADFERVLDQVDEACRAYVQAFARSQSRQKQ